MVRRSWLSGMNRTGWWRIGAGVSVEATEVRGVQECLYRVAEIGSGVQKSTRARMAARLHMKRKTSTEQRGKID